MIVKIGNAETEALKKVCALADAHVVFYTVESNELIVQAEIKEVDGREVPAKDLWHICRSFCAELQMEELRNK